MNRFALALSLVVLSAAPASADYMDHFAERRDVGIHKAPYLGNAELVLLLVEVDGHPPLDLDRIYRFFNGDRADGFVHYMETVSLGRYHPHVTVAPIVRYSGCPLPAASFPNCVVPRGDIAAFTAGIDMIREVVKRTNEDGAGFDFAKADVNGRNGTADGWADGVMLLTNVAFGGIAFPFGYFNRGDNLNGSSGGPLIVDGVKIGHVAIAGEDDVFTMVHEFGHVMGLTDLYDEGNTYPGLQFSLMGAWGYDPKIPLHDAESRFRLRWSNWHQVQGKQRVAIAPAETTGEVWRLGTGNEYFLIENRGPGAFDQSFTTRGLVVYHVDRTGLRGEEGRFQDRILSCVNCNKWHPYILNLQGDGKFELQADDRATPNYEDDLFRDGDELGADESEVPLSADHQVASTNFYSGKKSGLSISGIQVTAEGPIYVTLTAPNEGQCGDRLCDEDEACAPLTCEDPGDSRAPGCGCSLGSPLLGLGLLGLLLLEQRFRRRKQGVFRA